MLHEVLLDMTTAWSWKWTCQALLHSFSVCSAQEHEQLKVTISMFQTSVPSFLSLRSTLANTAYVIDFGVPLKYSLHCNACIHALCVMPFQRCQASLIQCVALDQPVDSTELA